MQYRLFEPITRSTGTVHTSARARLTSVAIGMRMRIRDRSPPTFNHLFIGPYGQSSLKISCKSVWKFLHKVANKQTVKHNLLGGGSERMNSVFLDCPHIDDLYVAPLCRAGKTIVQLIMLSVPVRHCRCRSVHDEQRRLQSVLLDDVFDYKSLRLRSWLLSCLRRRHVQFS